MKKTAMNLMLVFLVLGLIIPMMLNTVEAQQTAISVIPSSQNVTLGSSFDINVTVTQITNLAGFEFKLFWPNAILNISRVTYFLPWSPNFVAKNETLRNFNSTHGRYWIGASLLSPAPAFTGNTTVLKAAFKTIGAGIAPLVLFDTKLGDNLANPIPHVRNSGSVTVSLVHDTAITQINVSPTTVVPGGTVTINATAANLGAATETFNVTAFYDTTTISTKNVTNLAPSGSKILTFIWNTTGVAVGSYTIKANATLAPGDANATNNNKVFTPNVAIQKTPSTISISTSAATVTVGSNLTISGAIAPVRANVDVIIESSAGTAAWTTLSTVKTNTSSQYSYKWKTSQVNVYKLRASWAGDTITASATSPNASVTVQKLDSTISIVASVTTLNVGENTTISGTISPAKANVDVKIETRVTGSATWTTLTTIKTDSTGKYSYVWKPDTANSYDIRASWQGDATTNSAISTTTTANVQGGGMDWTLYIIAIVIAIVIIAAIVLYFTKIRKTK